MKRSLLLIIAALIAIPGAFSQGVKFAANLDEATARAKETEKPLFIVLLQHGNEFSETMYSEVFTDPEVGEIYNSRFVPLLLWDDSQQAHELFYRYGFKYYPAFIFLSQGGDFLKKDAGARDKYMLLDLADNYKDPEADRLAALRRSFDDGTIDRDGLMNYIAFSSYFGIRNSEALEKWIEAEGDNAVSVETLILVSNQDVDANSKPFRFVVDNAEDFAQVASKSEVDIFIYMKYLEHLQSLDSGWETFVAGLRANGYAYADALEEHMTLGPLLSNSPNDEALRTQINRFADKYPVAAPLIGMNLVRMVNKRNPGFDGYVAELATKVAATYPVHAVEMARYIANNYLIVYADIMAANPWVDRYLAWSGNPDFEKNMTTVVKKATGEYPADNYGKQMPDVTLKDLNGNPVALSDFRGKFVLLDFWASWCGPCIAEIPHVKEVYERFKDAPIQFISVTSDKDDDDWKKAAAKIDVPWLNLSANGTDMLRQYGVEGIPRIIILDPEGRIAADHMNGSTLELQLRLLAEKYNW